jgi:hypothetical protein
MHSFHLSEPYRARDVCFLELWETQGWRVKVYGITYPGRTMPNETMIRVVQSIALRRLSQVEQNQHYGIAFLIIHMAREVDFVSLDWWTDENVLRQALFTCPPDNPSEIKEITSSGLFACVWELHVHNFESMAWISDVLNNPRGPDLNAYLDRRFSGSV